MQPENQYVTAIIRQESPESPYSEPPAHNNDNESLNTSYSIDWSNASRSH